MAARRTFAALIDQDSVMCIEYAQEKAGFRLLDTRVETRRFSAPDAAADAAIDLLADMNAPARPTLSIVLAALRIVLSHARAAARRRKRSLRPIILREIQRSFNITDPAIAFVDQDRSSGAMLRARVVTPPQQVLIAGAPQSVVSAIQSRLTKAKIEVEGMTVMPEVFRRLYDGLDGSTEATAMLVCLANGPHVAFFVNGHLEMAIDPPLALEGEAPLDSAVIVDQLERGAIFLRQQARGTVATRLLLAAPAEDFENISSTVEARTGMRVAPLGSAVGSPETIVAMGAVLAARQPNRLDLFPRAPTFDARVRRAVRGPAALTSAVMAFAGLAVVWAVIQFATLMRVERDTTAAQAQVTKSLTAVSGMRASAAGRARIAGIRSALAASRDEHRRVADVLRRLAESAPQGAQLDSFSIERIGSGWKTTIFGRAAGTTGSAAVTAATAMYHHLQGESPKLKNLEFAVSAYLPKKEGDSSKVANLNRLLFTIAFLAPSESQP